MFCVREPASILDFVGFGGQGGSGIQSRLLPHDFARFVSGGDHHVSILGRLAEHEHQIARRQKNDVFDGRKSETREFPAVLTRLEINHGPAGRRLGDAERGSRKHAVARDVKPRPEVFTRLGIQGHQARLELYQ